VLRDEDGESSWSSGHEGLWKPINTHVDEIVESLPGYHCWESKDRKLVLCSDLEGLVFCTRTMRIVVDDGFSMLRRLEAPFSL
jgi:uncharacterized protein CbrC (UPF0167 family)